MSNHKNSDEQIDFQSNLPLLPVRDLVIYPFMILPLFVGRKSSIEAVEQAMENHDRMIFLSSQKDMSAESPEPHEIYNVGTVAMIMRMRKLPDGRIKVLVQGLSKARIIRFEQEKPFFKCHIEKIQQQESSLEPEVCFALARNVKENLGHIIKMSQTLSSDILMVLEDVEEPGRISDLVASNLNLKVEQAQDILETFDPGLRLKKINDMLEREIKILNVQEKIKSSTSSEISKTQKEFFLREQMKAIKSELGDDPSQDEFLELKNKILESGLSEEAEKEALKQLARLERMHPDSSESNILRTYLEWMYEVPWSEKSEEINDLEYAMKTLDEEHFELKSVKERIIEYLAVKNLKGGSLRGPIICFSGPPGVGKTSLGKSIAKATGREFVRISLGGIKDESEIRGHRRTYVGAMPGRFIQAMKQAKTINPLIMLDEIDKLGSDYKGDPSSALLEVLDPEQNHLFRDHYLNVQYDLSQVMFIATANVIENIPGPLRDRMELINISGYSPEEKYSISEKHIIPKQMNENGISQKNIHFNKESIEKVIKGYTHEPGLRNLERKIGTICRKVAKKVATKEQDFIELNPKVVEELLGPAYYSSEENLEQDEVGVATGLAWTQAGGETLYIEASLMKGQGLTLTGQLGEVMKESAQAAMGFIKSRAHELEIDEDIFSNKEIHLHIPAGAIPKDGPSAGVTLATAMVSLLTNTPISKDIAMTGEITLTGKVLPVGGIKEKSLAALRHGIKTILIPWKNQKDLVDIPESYKKELQFIPVKNIKEVLEVALLDWQPKVTKKTSKNTKTHHKGKELDKAA